MVRNLVNAESPSLAKIVDPETAALVIIDVQNDFCSVGGACASVGDDTAIMSSFVERLSGLLTAARRTGMLVVFVRASYDPIVLSEPWYNQLISRRGFGSGICLEGSPGIEFVKDISPRGVPNEIVVTKHRYSAFAGTDLDLLLRNNGIKTVVITGVTTEGCPESTARDAFFLDYRVVTVSDCVASFSAPRHAASLAVLSHLFGPVVDSHELIRIWGGNRVNADARTKCLGSNKPWGRANTALILVNVQNDFCTKGGVAESGKLGIGAIQTALATMQRTLKAARDTKSLVVHLVAQSAPAFDGRRASKGIRALSHTEVCCKAGTKGAEIVAGFEPITGEPVIISRRSGGFNDTSLDMILRSNEIENIVVVGTTTSGAVESTVREASARDYMVHVVRDGVANYDADAQLHASSIAAMELNFAVVDYCSEIVGGAAVSNPSLGSIKKPNP